MRSLLRIGLVGICITSSIGLIGCHKAENNEMVSVQDVKAVEVQASETIKSGFYYKDSAEKRLVQLEQVLKDTYGKVAVALYYQYNYVDLNGDLSNELLVWLRAKQSNWEDKYVTEFIILDEQFKILYTSEQVRAPIVVLDQRTNGWSDIAFFIDRSQYKLVKMSKKGYDLNQNSNENVIDFDVLEGVCYLSNAINEQGFQIK